MEALLGISTEIAGRRRALGMAQAQLAAAASTSRATIDALENGRAHEIGFYKLTRILAALGMELRLQDANQKRPTLDDLMNEESDD